MHPLRTETLELKLDNNIAALTVTGEVGQETLQESIEWIEAACEANDNLAICVDMAKTDFDGLAQINKSFRNVGRVLRYAHDIEKCAVMSDSQFIRNTAEVEGSVIPGMEIKAYDLDEIAPATNWLSDDDTPTEDTPITDSQPVPVLAEQSKQIASANAEPTEEAVTPVNPWDNLDVKAALN